MKRDLFKIMTLVILLAFLMVFVVISCKGKTTETTQECSQGSIAETSSGAATVSDTTAASSSSAETTVPGSTSESSSTQTTATTSNGQEAKLTQQQAIEIALTAASGTVDRVETEIEHGKLVWKVRLISNGTRTDVRIDDETGKIIRIDTD